MEDRLTMPNNPTTIAALIARFLEERGVDRVFGLCGGHIQPIWDAAARLGIRIIDVRDERAAVHMAQAHSDLTGRIGVALVTAGPGLTNAVTGIANAHVARTPVLVISGTPPRPQSSKGALQELPQADIVRPITRSARAVGLANEVLPALDEAMGAAEGRNSDPGPAYLDFPTDLLREAIGPAQVDERRFQAIPSVEQAPDPSAIERAADLLWSAKRPVVISGRGARGAGRELSSLLEALGALYLDTSESRGVLPDDHPAAVPAMRGSAMQDADVVLTIGRKLDFQLGYGSPAVFPNARLIRLGLYASEVEGNREADVGLRGSTGKALEALLAAGGRRIPATDASWVEKLKSENRRRREGLQQTMRDAEPGSDGLMHPLRLMGAVQDALAPDAIIVTLTAGIRCPSLGSPCQERCTWTLERWDALALAFHSASPPRWPTRTGRSQWSAATAPSVSTPLNWTPACATGRGRCSSSPTTLAGTSSGTTKSSPTTAMWWAPNCPPTTMPSWPAPSACALSGLTTRPTCPPPSGAPLTTPPPSWT